MLIYFLTFWLLASAAEIDNKKNRDTENERKKKKREKKITRRRPTLNIVYFSIDQQNDQMKYSIPLLLRSFHLFLAIKIVFRYVCNLYQIRQYKIVLFSSLFFSFTSTESRIDELFFFVFSVKEMRSYNTKGKQHTENEIGYTGNTMDWSSMMVTFSLIIVRSRYLFLGYFRFDTYCRTIYLHSPVQFNPISYF